MHEKEKRRICLLDLDTTLYKGEFGYVIADLFVFLKNEGLFSHPAEDMKTFIKDMILSATDRTRFALELITQYYRGLKGKDIKDIDAAFTRFWETKNTKALYSHTIPLLSRMNNNEYETIIVSGSPKESLSQDFRKIISFKKLYATHGKIKGTKYNGECTDFDERATDRAKSWVVSAIRETQEFDKDNSFAFGDSESDIPLLSAVNPKHAFFVFHTTEPFAWEDVAKLKDKKEFIEETYKDSKWHFVEVGDELIQEVDKELR
jgi:HAD superfamily phosphoserine phosphatase-like hydrolase